MQFTRAELLDDCSERAQRIDHEVAVSRLQCSCQRRRATRERGQHQCPVRLRLGTGHLDVSPDRCFSRREEISSQDATACRAFLAARAFIRRSLWEAFLRRQEALGRP